MFKITSIGGKPNSYSQKEYLLTNISDLDKLPHINNKGIRKTKTLLAMTKYRKVPNVFALKIQNGMY